MATNEEIQESLKAVFRQGELQRRDARRKIILNHIALESESLTDSERAIDAKVKKQLKQASINLERETSPSYSQRRWAALLGR